MIDGVIVIDVWRGDFCIAKLWRRPAQVARTIDAWKALIDRGLTFDVYDITEVAA